MCTLLLYHFLMAFILTTFFATARTIHPPPGELHNQSVSLFQGYCSCPSSKIFFFFNYLLSPKIGPTFLYEGIRQDGKIICPAAIQPISMSFSISNCSSNQSLCPNNYLTPSPLELLNRSVSLFNNYCGCSSSQIICPAAF